MSLAAVRYVLELEDRLRAAESRAAELEQHLARAGVRVERPQQQAHHTSMVTRSVSVELVHIPRQPRSPRWRNEDD